MDFKDMLKSTVAAVKQGARVVLKGARRNAFAVEGKAGNDKRGQPYRRLIKYERKGPFHEQVGWKAKSPGAGVYIPLMRTVYRHHFLHATKGWRVATTARPAVMLHNIRQPRQYGPAVLGFQNRHGHWVHPLRKLAKGEKLNVIVPCVKNAHKLPRKEIERAPLAA